MVSVTETQSMLKLVKGACRRRPALCGGRPLLRGDVVRRMVTAADDVGEHEIADAFAIARCFIFRVGSEMLVLSTFPFDGNSHGVKFCNAIAEVTLVSRKISNALVSYAVSACAQQGKRLCAAHRLRSAVFRATREGRDFVFTLSYSCMLAVTRRYAAIVGCVDVGTQAFRRVAAQDMAAQGSRLWEILQAGGCRSAAFMSYMNQ